ncbi:polysialic acid transport protein KpsM [Clostridiales bacterium]|nr:polysialic acid transport protein KpsM [Clostridiales bacterium]
MEKTKNSDHTFWNTFNQYKSLLRELTRKSLKLKYRDSVLGIFWSFVQPLLNMAVLSVVFSSILGKRGNIACYPVYLFTGRLLFEFFTTSTKAALMSFRTNAPIIKKVYVPKYIYPLSSILSTFVNLAISLLCFICVWIFFRLTGISGGDSLTISGYALLFFIPLLLLLIFTTGVGLILAVFQVYFRDIKYIWDVFCTLLFYAVPIIYSIDTITSKWTRMLIEINPIYHIMELFRQCVYYGKPMDLDLLLGASAWSFGVLLLGIFIFNKKSDDLIFHM